MLRALKEIIKKISDTKLGILGIFCIYYYIEQNCIALHVEESTEYFAEYLFQG